MAWEPDGPLSDDDLDGLMAQMRGLPKGRLPHR